MSKVTSLSAQLKRLQVPQTNLLNTVADRRRVSFLYDSSEAANMDSEAVYCLAINGLEQLKSIDQHTFESFEATLFNATSISFERAIQTKQVNKNLNDEIRRFLVHLSPYFMLKPAHKCLEWLVYRYQIHSYNQNELFMCILPYHETNYFVRALQMLNLETLTPANQLWMWLVDNQKKGVQLAASTLSTHVYSDLAFFNFIIGYLNYAIELLTDESKLESDVQRKHWVNSLNFVFSFLAKTLLQSINQLSAETSQSSKSKKNANNKQQEAFLAQLLPVLFNGFKSDLIVYKQTSYLLGSFLFEKFKFTSEAVNKALFTISKGLSTFRLDKNDQVSSKMDVDDDENETETNTFSLSSSGLSIEKIYSVEQIDCIKSAILAICLIVQTQSEDSEKGGNSTNTQLINRNFMRKLLKNFNQEKQIDLVYSVIDSLNQSYKIDKFLKFFLVRMLADLVETDLTRNVISLNKVNVDLDGNDDEMELLKNDKNIYFKLADKLVTLLNMNRSPHLVELLIDSLFHLLAKQIENNNMPNFYVEFHLCELIFKYECKYPSLFDSCLDKISSHDELSQKQRNYVLTVISCKFNSFKCKTAFKYQQIKTVNNEPELNLHLALNHANEAIRANAFSYILNEIDAKSKKPIDIEFVREQLITKLSFESSPLVLKSILNFNTKLFDYLTWDQLLDKSNDLPLLLKFFRISRLDTLVAVENENSKRSGEIREHYAKQNVEWFECRDLVIQLVFNDLLKTQPRDETAAGSQKDLLFNTFLIINSNLFELGEINLIKKLKNTQFYAEMQQQSEANGVPNPAKIDNKKNFYSATRSSISITKLSEKASNGHECTSASEIEDDELNIELNELYEQFIQTSVKHMLSNSNKTGNGSNSIKKPKFFERLATLFDDPLKNHRGLSLIDLIAYELSVRICAQSLFLSNSAFFLHLALQFLVNLFGSNSVYNLKFKAKHLKNATQEAIDLKKQQQQLNAYSNLIKISLKQALTSKSINLIELLYLNLFKSIAIQNSNFVNKNSRNEIEALVGDIYVFLCHAATPDSNNHAWFFNHILAKFIQGNFTTGLNISPTKTSTTASMQNFYHFSFKFLLYLPSLEKKSNQLNSGRLLAAQIHTLCLYAQNVAEFLEFTSKKIELFSSLLFIISWCLTSDHNQLRLSALNLLEKVHDQLNNGDYTNNVTWWSIYLKKLLKHRQEIEIDGNDYVKTKSLNKIFDKNANENNDTISKYLNQYMALSRANINQRFSASSMAYYLDSDLILVKFKHSLLDLFKDIKDDFKSNIMDSIFNCLIRNLNDSASLVVPASSSDEDRREKQLEIEINKSLIEIIVSGYLLTRKSPSFLNANQKSFDLIVGYLNNNTSGADAFMIKCFKHQFVQKLGEENRRLHFFQQLSGKHQLELLKSCFDIHLNGDVDQQIARGALLSFDMSSAHLVSLFNERAQVRLAKKEEKAEGEPSTSKQMKKQLVAETVYANKVFVEWRALKAVLELLQSLLIQNDSQMETDLDEGREQDTYIDLIPYLFLVLEKIENQLAQNTSNPSQLMEKENDVENNTEDESESLLYLELICLNTLLLIYKLNKQTNRANLDESKFNIELLMQMLQTKQETTAVVIKKIHSNETSNSSAQIDRLNVQQHILILLSEIAGIFPDKVLEHVIIMFIFVGNRLARKDDAYSFQVINQVIRSILPSIVDSVQQQQQQQQQHFEATENVASSSRLVKTIDVIQRHQKQLPYVSSLVCKILQSFVVSLPHMPAHRKAIIFAQLMQIVGLDDYLWITSIQSIDYYLVQSSDLLNFTNNLEQLTSKQQLLLADNPDAVSKSEKKLRDTIKTCIQSMISLFAQFEPIDLIQSSIYLIAFLTKYISKLFETALKTSIKGKSSEKKSVYSHLACQLDNYNLLQMKYLAYNLLQFVSDLFVSEELITKLAGLYDAEAAGGKNPHTALFQNLLEKILVLALKLTQLTSLFEQQQQQPGVTNKLLVDDLKKYHKAILNKVYDLIEKTINLLDTRQFIDVIKYLINTDTSLVQIKRRALVLLNNKLRKYEPGEAERTLLMTLLDDLLKSIQLNEPNASLDVEINNQTVLFSIKLICKRIGEHSPLAFVKVLGFLSENLIDRSLYFLNNDRLKNVNLLSSVLLCIGEVCLKLKTNSLKHLNQIMMFNLDIIDHIRKKLGDSEIENDHELIEDFNRIYLTSESAKKQQLPINNEFKNYELLILSSVTCLLKIVQNMFNFLSPYLKRLIYTACSFSYLARLGSENANNLSHIETKLSQLRTILATLIPLRLLAPILNEQSSIFLITDSSKSIIDYKMKIKHVEFYMHIARTAVKNASQEDLLANIRTIKTMYMNLFNMRAGFIKSNRKFLNASSTSSQKHQHQQTAEGFVTNDLSKYENHAINAFCELTFKLSEDLFRPMFFSLYEWAISNENDYSAKDRLITFYRTTHKLSDRLKNLFVLFAPQFVQNAADLLNQLNSSKTDEKFFTTSASHEKEHILLSSVVDTLANVFLNDTQKVFVNKDRFNLLMEPLIDQLENEIEYDSYPKYVDEHLGLCIAHLGACVASDETSCRKLNYQILLKTKHSSAQVRLAALDVLSMFSRKIGDIYNSYLGETVPFLAELMEDPVEEVEDKVQNLIKELEDMLGENLQSQFV